MKKQHVLLSCALGWALMAGAETVDIPSFRYAGPYAVQAPFQIDSVDVQQRTFAAERFLEMPLSLEAWHQGTVLPAGKVPGSSQGYALHTVGFLLENRQFTQAKLKVEGLSNYRLFIDGKPWKEADGALEPGTHAVVVKYLSEAGKAESLQVSVETARDGIVTLREDGQRLYGLGDVLHGTRIAGVDLSPNGQFLITSYRTTRVGGASSVVYRLTELATGRVLVERGESLHWMPRSNQYYYTRAGVEGRQLVTVDPLTGAETVRVQALPEGLFRWSPAEDYLLFTLTQEGPKERKDIYEIVEPDDRQPGWRNRSYLAKYDLQSGLLQPLTFGYHNVWAADISSDGRQVLVMKSESRLTVRPTTLFSLYRLDVETLKAEVLVDKDGFLSGASFSPDGRQVLLSGSPEALGSVGKQVQEGQVPSMTDGQLYLMEVSTRKVTPLTRDFHPSVQQSVWCQADGQVYFTAENRDCSSLFRLNPQTGEIRQVDLPEEMVSAVSLAKETPLMAWYGQSASNSDRLYTLQTKKGKVRLLDDLSSRILEGVQLGECQPWSFVNSRGDTICGRFYLPPRMDPNRKYPLIVNYYGGCSPVGRDFESRYPHHAYAALGYVVYVIEPSGATGFGQEFSARHVNTAGEGVAQDIIEGTRRFCEEHPYVNPKKIGCIGASYGGFMTQYLQTETDLFAAAISHAGISDHTSYWGEGYWGYSYSEVSMAHSYPWTRPDLFVKQSPLFRADRIHTPLLFLHGDADMNVPVGESIQMFNALKLLGRETAFVAVTNQDHHIVNYEQRIRWQHTIWAWFAKWLQDNDSWWNTLYPPKAL